MTIDELFSSEEERRDPPPGRSGRAGLTGPVIVILVLAGLAYAGLYLAKLTVSPLVLVATSAILVLTGRSLRWLRPPAPSRQAGRRHEERGSGVDGFRLAVSRWETLLDGSATDAQPFQRRVLPRLAELADERLRQRHGITRTSDPQKARAILGDPLWTYLAAPPRRAQQPRELDKIVTALEKL